MKLTTILIAAFGLLLSSGFTTEAISADSKTYTLVSYEMTISGTSTLHDWEAKVNTVHATISMANSNPDFTNVFEKLEVKVPVNDIKSGRGGMDSRIYDALKSRRHSEIMYNLSEITSSESTSDGTYTLVSVGDLTIAGETNSITMNVTAIQNGNGTYTFEGSYTTKMSEFGIDPPTAMMGTVRSGDEITVDFKITVRAS